jgi:hypothetical protein
MVYNVTVGQRCVRTMTSVHIVATRIVEAQGVAELVKARKRWPVYHSPGSPTAGSGSQGRKHPRGRSWIVNPQDINNPVLDILESALGELPVAVSGCMSLIVA